MNRIKKWLYSIAWQAGFFNNQFPGTSRYWDQLYKKGGNSGPGSYQALAQFKADFLNHFIQQHEIKKIIDLGCGDGHQVSLLHIDQYYGFDISEQAIQLCTEKFRNDPSKQFFLHNDDFSTKLDQIGKARLAISLDVLFHLVEDSVFHQYMQHLFEGSDEFIIIYSTNYNSRQQFHEKNRCFTDWIKRHRRNWRQIGFVPNRYPFDKNNPDNTSESDFYIFEKMKDNSFPD